MAKFTFPIPGRSKKQALVATPEGPRSKAHKILGSTNISIDGNYSWEDTSASGFSVTISDTTAPTTQASGVGRHIGQRKGVRDWSEESEAAPHHVRLDALVDEDDYDDSDFSGGLRGQPSSSTIRSFYDKTKQPLAVSQQTSSSAMAKGPPTKAQRLLDMENVFAAATNKKKKPAMLDLSHLKPSSRFGKNRDWQAAAAGNELPSRSPSLLSPGMASSDGRRDRSKLRKRPTMESMRARSETSPRPGTGGSGRPAGVNTDELPSLYRHYEQMSFAQFMDDTTEVAANAEPTADWSASTGPVTLVKQEQVKPYRHQYQKYREDTAQELSHGREGLAPPSIKFDHPSPTDCSASISSRHTRTSKASRHTEKSFQAADLQEQSMLMLSSDSEEDEEADTHTELPRIKGGSEPLTRYSLSSTVSTTSERLSGGTMLPASMGNNGEDRRGSQSTLPVKRTSSVPYGFLPMQTGLASKTASQVTSVRSRDSSQWDPKLNFLASPSTSTLSGASFNLAIAKHNRLTFPDSGTLDSTTYHAPAVRESERDDADSDLEHDEPDRVVRVDAGHPAPKQALTPPLSPSSMDFTISTVHDEAMPLHKEHFMGVTQQEQMLITALRQKRELMRKNSEASQTSASPRRVKGHRSKASSVILTDALKFGFPLPPGQSHGVASSAASASSTLNLPLQGDEDQSISGVSARTTSTADGTIFMLSPPPSTHHRPSRNDMLNPSHHQTSGYENHGNHVLLYFDPTSPPALTAEGTESKFDLRTPEEIQPPTPRAVAPETKRYPRPRPANRRNPPAVEDVKIKQAPAPIPTATEIDMPRPDSPVSTDLSDMPNEVWSRRASNNQARLSAVGPPRLGGEFGWWDDDD